ncbi:sulfite exporter TauE/SafE family protein [Hyphococcus sp. DH-69]|uniref:sulfite exporter TauE/SafE family protein n=1 Tax=Hyphococcus formosus TaxID=3143534 RepID=UPI00398B5BE0
MIAVSYDVIYHAGMEMIAALMPDGVPLWAAAAAIFASFFTSALTAAFGLGGGLALLAIMSSVFPATAVIPIHGVAQAGSNAGRFYLQRKEVVWPIVLWFSAGGVLGAVLGGRLALEMPVWLLRGGVACFILYTVWGPRPASFAPGPKTFFTTGAIAAFLTMFFGATGPIAATMIGAANLDRLKTVSTHAAAMVLQHLMKIVTFGLLGFAFADWLWVILAILLAGFAGAYAGTHFLRRMPESIFRRGFKTILTLIALYLFGVALVDLRTG